MGRRRIARNRQGRQTRPAMAVSAQEIETRGRECAEGGGDGGEGGGGKGGDKGTRGGAHPRCGFLLCCAASVRRRTRRPRKTNTMWHGRPGQWGGGVLAVYVAEQSLGNWYVGWAAGAGQWRPVAAGAEASSTERLSGVLPRPCKAAAERRRSGRCSGRVCTWAQRGAGGLGRAVGGPRPAWNLPRGEQTNRAHRAPSPRAWWQFFHWRGPLVGEHVGASGSPTQRSPGRASKRRGPAA